MNGHFHDQLLSTDAEYYDVDGIVHCNPQDMATLALNCSCVYTYVWYLCLKQISSFMRSRATALHASKVEPSITTSTHK